MIQSADVVIVGGGVIGCAIAYELSKSGLQVAVVEKDKVGCEASSASAGMLVPSNAISEEGERTLLFELYSSSAKMFSELVPELEETTGIYLEHVNCGALRVSQSEEEEELLHEQFELWQGLELPVSWVDREEVHKIEPELAPEVGGGILSTDEQSIDGTRFVEALARAVFGRGVNVVEGCFATGVRHTKNHIEVVMTSEGEIATRHVVIAAGAWSRFCCDWFGISVPIAPVRGQMLSLRSIPRTLTKPVFTYNGGLFPKTDGSVYVGATIEQVGFDRRNTAEGIALILALIPALVPSLEKGTIDRMWAGLRPWCEDGAPVIGPLPEWDGVTVATGHYRMGIIGSPVTARVVKELIVDGRWDPSLETFSPKRFIDQ